MAVPLLYFPGQRKCKAFPFRSSKMYLIPERGKVRSFLDIAVLGPIFKQVICFTMAPRCIIARYLPFWHHMKWMRWMIFPLKFERETLTNWHWSRTIHIFLRDCRQPECLMKEKQFIAKWWEMGFPVRCDRHYKEYTYHLMLRLENSKS